MLRKHRASLILKRLSTFANQHPLQEVLKEFGRVIQSIFVLKYIDDVTLRQTMTCYGLHYDIFIERKCLEQNLCFQFTFTPFL